PGIDVRDVIQAHRRRLVESMQRYTRIKAEAGPGEMRLALVVDAELFRLEGVVRWLDAADSRIGQLASERSDRPLGSPEATLERSAMR
ncbi:MAG TPA: PadR family transcriptional regulator, partial [Acidimicrobiia bacterium]